MNTLKAALSLCFVTLCVDICLGQRDCTCEGYQYYDCIQAGFEKGKVPEGESYFVDFGSTECSCPQGGGKIICHFIPCPEIPPNCIDIVRPADGCVQCRRIGCTHGTKKYQAGHSFQAERCRVCHCPNEGGRLTCSAVPNCDPRGVDQSRQVPATGNNSPPREVGGRRGAQQQGPVEPLSSLPAGNTLPLYKPDPPSSGTQDYDYAPPEPTSPTIQDGAQPLESTTVPLARPETRTTGTQGHPDPEVGLDSNPTATGVLTQKPTLPSATAARHVTTENHRPRQDVVERTRGLEGDGSRAAQGTATAPPTHGNKAGRHAGQRKRSESRTTGHGSPASDGQGQTLDKGQQGLYPTVQFSPTNRAPVRMREDGQQRQSQTLHNYQTQDVDEDPQVSAKELVKTCCETGEKWASANGHCRNMEPPTRDRHSICWTAQQQCCLGSQRLSRCSAGIHAARAGSACDGDAVDKCGVDSFKECCGCCSLGLQFLREGHPCEAHRYLDHHCRHVFMNCCKGEEGPAGSQHGWHTLRERPTQDSNPPPQKVSDSPYPKEAFSIGEERDDGNAVDGPVEVEDMDECQMYEGNICHHRCVNTPGSFRCECFPGYAMQDDDFTCALETVDEENRLREDDGAPVEPTSTVPAPTQASVPLDPCEGTNPCEQQCTPVGGRPRCSCSPGFSLRADGRSCEDVDECSSVRACQPDELCENTPGSFVCRRPVTCPPGHRLSGGGACEDIDECTQGSHGCGVGFECANTLGSFRCNPKPRCPAGFTQDALGNCVDIDECGAVAQPCSSGFSCVNTAGSYVCQRKLLCSRGYHASPDGSRCIDVDECQSSLHRCGEGQLCHNLPGSYRCECQTGYQYDSFRRMCVDVNECWRYQSRLCAQTCENTPGSYECSCTSGFRLSGDGKNCEDVNECLGNPCSQECANIYGSYQCYCRQGYYLREDGHTCEDIDECSQSIGHLCTYKCVNVPGSYRCTCPEFGYTMSPNGRSCRDIDECTTGSHNCSLAETCYNIQGGYRCLSLSCPPNYRKGSDTRCERITCANYLECQNSPLRITYYYLSFQSNIIIPAQIFRIGPSPAYSGDNVILSITQGNDDNYFGTRKLNAYTGAVQLQRQVDGPRDFLLNVEMKLWRQGTFTTFQARIYIFITANSL